MPRKVEITVNDVTIDGFPPHKQTVCVLTDEGYFVAGIPCIYGIDNDSSVPIIPNYLTAEQAQRDPLAVTWELNYGSLVRYKHKIRYWFYPPTWDVDDQPVDPDLNTSEYHLQQFQRDWIMARLMSGVPLPEPSAQIRQANDAYNLIYGE